jgi:hypothetical protein
MCNQRWWLVTTTMNDMFSSRGHEEQARAVLRAVTSEAVARRRGTRPLEVRDLCRRSSSSLWALPENQSDSSIDNTTASSSCAISQLEAFSRDAFAAFTTRKK